MQLVLRVNTDDALRIHTTTTSEQLREALRTAGISVSSITRRRRRRRSGSKASRRTATPSSGASPTSRPATNYDRNSGAGGTLRVHDEAEHRADMREQAVEQALQTIDRRVNELGVTEPNISRYGSSQRPDPRADARRDRRRAREGDHPHHGAPRAQARRSRAGADEGSAAAAVQRQAAGGHGDRVRARRRQGDTGTVYYLVRKIAAVTGQDLRGAKPTLDENNRPAVSFALKNDGARKFGKVTGENIGRYLAIVLDNRVVSAPRIEGRITDEGRISGSFTSQEVARPVADAAVGRAAGDPDLSRGARGRPVARRRLDPLRRDRVARRAAADHRVHARLLQAVGRQRGRRAASST